MPLHNNIERAVSYMWGLQLKEVLKLIRIIHSWLLLPTEVEEVTPVDLSVSTFLDELA